MAKFHANKCKVQLKLAINRLKMLAAKKNSINNQQRREIATLLEKGKDESARVKVEHIILEDLQMEAMEILELYCDTLIARFGLLEQMKHCDPGISESVNSIIYAAPRSQVKELISVRDQLISKFGPEFGKAAMENQNEVVNARIVQKLRIAQPDPFLVTQYLKEIAKAYNISWEPPSVDLMNPGGGDGEEYGGLPADLASLLPPLSGNASPFPPSQNYPVNYQAQPVPVSPQPSYPANYQPTSTPASHSQASYPANFQSSPNPPAGHPQASPARQPSVSPSQDGQPLYPPRGYQESPERSAQIDSLDFPSIPTTSEPSKIDFPAPPSHVTTKDSDSIITTDTSNTGTGDVPDFDELTKRFQALKKT